ncbi:MAG: phosphatase PAP2 family protein [Bacteroidales bacterium]|nr:phosphatase PAP2 family protein [Bacteroidales bacterium]
MRKIVFVFLLVLLFGILLKNTAIAQKDSVYHADFSANYFKSYLTDTRDLLLSPLHWNKWEWGGAALFAGTSVLLINHDLQIYNYFQENRSEKTDRFSKNFLEPWGSGVYSMPLMTLFYLQGTICKNNRSKKTALLGIKTYLLTGVAVTIPKMLFNRMRPYQNPVPDPNQWRGPFAGTFYKSFPSGHTTSVFAVATILSSEYKNTIWVPILSYSIATLSGLSRINDTKHWLSDVFGAAVFGWSMGKLIHSANNWKVSLSPYSNGSTTGVYLSVPIGNNRSCYNNRLVAI